MKEFMKVVLSDKEEGQLEIAVQNTKDVDQSFGLMTGFMDVDARSLDQMIEDELDRYQARNMPRDVKHTELFDSPSRQCIHSSMQHVYFNALKWW
ncbi:hypothetical protein O9G_005753 [Rozella allomycis CSF55]|uniref:Uncharacterized protein n=1 Tax=Rozella allomycis (strain CSF55) TaxID=988480 RepID=A0A075AR94_ROZAC|nr:hypothetical protein O9G_005753 [Rozella allomycis CSF55]|eukprot:EPZ32680.1 hypothetical protein O9G_005753 [Rozella allomycis CSF55]